MTTERWLQIKEVFNQALERELSERAEFLARLCSDDVLLRTEVESLLTSYQLAADFIETPASDVAAALLADDHTVLKAGQMIGHFKILEVLARGGMGEVYLADDARLGRKVALKLLPPHFTIDPYRVRRFEQEARAASALNHPNIVTVHDIGHSDSLHFIATEFVHGKTLRERITTNDLTVGEILDVAIQIASALEAAHTAGIVHRDIKPENIMVRDDGVVKVLDFGLAKLTPQQWAPGDEEELLPTSIQTNPGIVMGTVGYMSPEQARAEEVDARSDIWSLGVVLYEMVAGVAPFRGETPSHVIVAILESEPPSLTSFAADVPAELDRIADSALRKDVSARYQSVRDLTIALKNLKAELELDATLERRLKSKGLTVKNAEHNVIREKTPVTIHDAVRQTSGFANVFKGIRTKTVVIGLLAFFLVAIAAIYFAGLRNKAGPTKTGRKSIAVLPVKPTGATTRDDLYEIGIADSLIHRLNSMGLTVRPLNVSREYADRDQDAIAAGKEQQVDYVLASHYQLADGKVRVTAQLFDIASGQLQRTWQLEHDAANLFAMQDAIAAEVGRKLEGELGYTSNRLQSKRGTTNEEAYRLYLHGMYLANARNLAASQKSIEALQQSVSLDPNYARAWAGLAYAHRTLSLYNFSVTTHETYQRSIEAINKALALDNNLSEAHSALCENKYLYEWDFAGAEVECRRALELDPGSAQAHEIFARYLMGRGRLDEAIAEIKAAIDLEPTSRFFQRNYGRALVYARRYSEAETELKRVLATDQSLVSTYWWLATAQALQGKESEAFESFAGMLAARKVDEGTVKLFRSTFMTAGWKGVLREWINKFDIVGGNNFDRALLNAQIGDKDQAFAELEKVLQLREIWITYLEVEPRLDPIRQDPRFAEVLRRIEPPAKSRS